VSFSGNSVQEPALEQRLYLAVIDAELMQSSVAQEVGTTVTRPKNHAATADTDERGHSGADNRALASGSLGTQLRVRTRHASPDLPDQNAGWDIRTHPSQSFDDDSARQVASVVPAHTIGHRPKAALRTAEEGVLVDSAHAALIGPSR
jgi:hypothetical protein